MWLVEMLHNRAVLLGFRMCALSLGNGDLSGLMFLRMSQDWILVASMSV